jgi:hypothetical protein
VEQSLSYQARRALLQQAVPQYREASPSQKRTLVDAFVAATGYHRTYRWLLNHAEKVQQTLHRPRPRWYGPEVQHAVFLVWNAANRICAKRLMPFLPIKGSGSKSSPGCGQFPNGVAVTSSEIYSPAPWTLSALGRPPASLELVQKFW